MNPRHKNPLALEVGAVVVVLALFIWWGYMSKGKKTTPPPRTPVTTTPVRVVNTNTPAPTAQTPIPVDQKKTDVDITGCKPAPQTANVTLGKSLIFENRDNKAHILQFTPHVLFTVTAKTKKEIKFDFDNITISRNYACDGKEVGTVFIRKQV